MTLRRVGVLAAAVLAAVLLVSGCSAASPTSSVTSASVPATWALPSGAVTLASMGLDHAPAGFAVPGGLTPLMTINQPNVVTLEVSAAEGQTLHDFLMLHLPGMGWQIASSSASSIIFASGGWQGAFTMSASNAMLTLRNQPL